MIGNCAFVYRDGRWRYVPNTLNSDDEQCFSSIHVYMVKHSISMDAPVVIRHDCKIVYSRNTSPDILNLMKPKAKS